MYVHVQFYTYEVYLKSIKTDAVFTNTRMNNE